MTKKCTTLKCKVTRTTKKVFSKENNKTYLWVIFGIAILFLLFWGIQSGSFKFLSITNINENPYTPSPNELTNQDSSYQVSLWFTPNTICSGYETTGYIDSNIPNGVCSIFVKSNGDWALTGNANLNSNGDVSQSTPINTVGVGTFRAICCDASGNCKVSNDAILTVNNCNQQSQSCIDTDGGIKEYIAGSVSYEGTQYNDNCKTSNSVNEYYCDDLGMMSLGVMPCTNGCDGGRCLTQAVPTCSDSDGGVASLVFGTCSDNSDTPYMEDSCFGGQLIEQTCSSENKCVSQTLSCHSGYFCDFGRCVPIPDTQTPQEICAENCNAIQLLGVDFNTGGCFPYNPQGALSMAQVCSKNNGVYANAIGCNSGDICCCR